ncbi:(2Fe-2S)-binding protein [Pseudenhygromyxa sp. WMMC2535]|nr:(2Fe-2S)-binding protein [Pseudenhygromyxa sp. WMMC2535]
MLVCICKGVSDRRISEEIRRGACTVKQIQDGCQAGTDCKSCVRQIRQMITTQAKAAHEAGPQPVPAC